jgi:hypothetical protein
MLIMAQTATLERSTTNVRDKLRQSIDRLQTEQHHLANLEAGQTRAHEQLRTAEDRLAGAEMALERVVAEEPQRLAHAYVTNGEVDADPVASAQSEVNTSQSEVTRLKRIEAAVTGEVERSQSTLRTLRASHYAAMAELVCTSPEYLALVAEHAAAWMRLRTVKQALRVVQAALKGQLPHQYENEAVRSEPLEPRVGFDVGELVTAWADAMSALEQGDADVELPSI